MEKKLQSAPSFLDRLMPGLQVELRALHRTKAIVNEAIAYTSFVVCLIFTGLAITQHPANLVMNLFLQAVIAMMWIAYQLTCLMTERFVRISYGYKDSYRLQRNKRPLPSSVKPIEPRALGFRSLAQRGLLRYTGGGGDDGDGDSDCDCNNHSIESWPRFGVLLGSSRILASPGGDIGK